MIKEETINLLQEKLLKFNQVSFIEKDPIFIPHQFNKKQDIEIAGFFAATLAWGQRPTIISKCQNLLERMDNAPYEFVTNAKDNDLKKILGFVHRTFNELDALYFIEFLRHHYQNNDSLESAFIANNDIDTKLKTLIINFNAYFFSLEDAPERTRKHVSSPIKNSACKRLNMYLRWMVRKDNNGVDFGLWNNIKPENLIIPCDVHVEKTAKILGLTNRPKADWTMAEEITEQLKEIDPMDPCKFDFALFGLGIEKYFI